MKNWNNCCTQICYMLLNKSKLTQTNRKWPCWVFFFLFYIIVYNINIMYQYFVKNLRRNLTFRRKSLRRMNGFRRCFCYSWTRYWTCNALYVFITCNNLRRTNISSLGLLQLANYLRQCFRHWPYDDDSNFVVENSFSRGLFLVVIVIEFLWYWSPLKIMNCYGKKTNDIL